MSQIWHLNYMLMTSYEGEKLQMSEEKIYDWKVLCMLTEHFLKTIPFLFVFFFTVLEFKKKKKVKEKKAADQRTRWTFGICVWFSAAGHELKTKQILLQRGLSNVQAFNDSSVHNIFLIHFKLRLQMVFTHHLLVNLSEKYLLFSYKFICSTWKKNLS